MHASQIPGSYSHVHYAFGSITSDFEVDLSQHFDQLEVFANSTGFKRILSFGGWSFSTRLVTHESNLSGCQFAPFIPLTVTLVFKQKESLTLGKHDEYSADSASIFRHGVTDANRKTFPKSVV